MKSLLLILLLPIIIFSQDVPARRARLDTIKAFSTNYGTLDTGRTKSRWEFTRPTQFDSLVRFFTNFAVPSGSSYDSTRLPYKDKPNTFTARQTMTSLAIDTIVSKNATHKRIYMIDTLVLGDKSGGAEDGVIVFNDKSSNLETSLHCAALDSNREHVLPDENGTIVVMSGTTILDKMWDGFRVTSREFVDADSFKINGTTFLNPTTMNLGTRTISSGAITSTGLSTFDSLKMLCAKTIVSKPNLHWGADKKFYLSSDTTSTGGSTDTTFIYQELAKKIPYTDTTSVVAMQWELDGKQSKYANITDTSLYYQRSDNVVLGTITSPSVRASTIASKANVSIDANGVFRYSTDTTATATVDTTFVITRYDTTAMLAGYQGKYGNITDTADYIQKLDTVGLFAGKLGGWIEIQRAADTTLNAANVTFVNLGELFFTMAANAAYEIVTSIWITKATDASAYTLALNCGGTPTNIGLVASALGIATDGTDQMRTSILNTATDSIQQTAATSGNGNLNQVSVVGQVINQNASNIFQFRWHQEIASSGVTIKRGSYLRYRRLY